MQKYLNQKAVLTLIPDRPLDAHKGNFGKILLLCGSRGYTGAPALAAKGALRSGAGLVYLAVPASIYEIEAVKMDEAIVLPVQDAEGAFAEESTDCIRQLLHDKDAVLIGCGMGQTNGTLAVLETVLKHFDGPVVVDADGINLLQSHKDLLRERTSPTVITPHAGEFKRIASVSGDRVNDAVAAALEFGVVVLLKGHNSIITDGETVYVNRTGNPGMAVGGSGDLLAGIIVSLLGQGLSPLEAAACGAWIHGAAGDLCASKLGQMAMLPTDMIDVLPRLLK